MNLFSARVRYLIALALGLSSASILYAFLVKGDFHAPLVKPPPPAPSVLISTGAVQSGENIAIILSHHGFPPDLVTNVERSLGQIYNLRRLQPGHEYEIVTSTKGDFEKLIYRSSIVQSYAVTRSSAGVFESARNETQTVWIEKRVSCDVTEFLYRDLMKQGYDAGFVDTLINSVADDIFAWKIDFFTEQRPGDKLDVLLEQEYPVGAMKPVNGHIRILVASYTGKATHQKENVAVRFEEPGAGRAEYYDLAGQAIRRAFLRAPFTHGAFRVSSGFNLHRFHPILRIYRPHHGTDYAAATGTPVAAIGKGVVVRAGWYKGYGKCIDIRHSPRYTSRYGHLSKIVVAEGQSIPQGKWIGNVGSTGLATGPHLHFEMLVDGVQQNFLRMSFPSASAVAEKNMPAFQRARDVLMARFNGPPALPARPAARSTTTVARMIVTPKTN